MSAHRTRLFVGMALITVVNVVLVVLLYRLVSAKATPSEGPIQSSVAVHTVSPADDAEAMPAANSDYLEVKGLPAPQPRTRTDIMTTNARSLDRALLVADVAVEADYEYYANVFNGDLVRASNYVTQLINAVSAIYERDLHVRLHLVFVRIATTPNSPWHAVNVNAELIEVKNYWVANEPNVPRAVVLFLSGRNLGGGLAYRGGLCTADFGYAVVGSIKGSFTTQPSDNTWDLVAVSHELGHIFGSRHSFCYKRGDNTTWYDQCYSGPPDGDCYSGPIQPSNGTIMSYCYVAGGSMSRINPISFSDGDPAMTNVMRQTAENTLASTAGGCLGYAQQALPEAARR